MRGLLLSKWSQVRSGLLETIDKFRDDELEYRPFSDGYSVVDTILHIAHEESIEVGYGLTRRLRDIPEAFDSTQFPHKRSLTKLLAQVHAHTVEYLDKLTDAELAQNIELPWGGLSGRAEMLFHTLEHEIHHRGELSSCSACWVARDWTPEKPLILARGVAPPSRRRSAMPPPMRPQAH